MTDNKTKRARFETVAARRVQKIIDSLDSLSKCSNKHNYEYTKQDVDKMLNEIKSKLRSVETSYIDGLGKGKSKFQF